MPQLVLMRHGATLWGQENKFAGWGDTPLSQSGTEEARAAGRVLKKNGLTFDLVFTSELLRARQTVDQIQQEIGLSDSTIKRDWRLNERHYGALQGHSRGEMISTYGNAKVVAWRRSYDAVPPRLDEHDARWLEQLKRLPNIPQHRQPRAESMAMAAKRAQAAWTDAIAPQLQGSKSILVVAHTSSLRGLSQTILGLDDEATEAFRIATAIPQLFMLDDNHNVLKQTDIQSGTSSRLRSWVNRMKPKRWGFA
jgi:2,3-bisphosphoglycerate-dependent phosphoglycerate mutase